MEKPEKLVGERQKKAVNVRTKTGLAGDGNPGDRQLAQKVQLVKTLLDRTANAG